MKTDLERDIKGYLKSYCKESNTPHYRLAKDLGINKHHFDAWWKGKTSMYFSEMVKLSKVGVSIKFVHSDGK